ncbi:MAG: T9SS type A sorting domain-containing protein [Bacteroidales bacterium]|nr:T9SS type A sorting domain-containing protein [Bacteroidales bacterium]OQA93331.1 MAG: hypothetical protein BWY27_00055 [Bacteroidetes bacterium ADurb.Bin234]
MKYINFLSITFMVTMSIQAQNYVNLRFTSRLPDGSYQALDSVKIINNTRGWEETIYYPDTLLQMLNSTGISEVENHANSIMQNIPNPFKGTTEVSLQLSAQEDVSLALYDLSGKQYAVYHADLPEGKHGFRLMVGIAQMYFLVLKTSNETQTVKLLATEASDAFRISYAGSEGYFYLQQQKANTNKGFQTNDSMRFIAYTTLNNRLKHQELKTKQAGTDQEYSFEFALGYAIGDIYYQTNGEVEGVVCWIADTVYHHEGKYFGNAGKLISIDERDTGTYGTINRPTYAFDSVDGRVNTAIHQALLSDTSTYLFKERLEAAQWCLDKGEGWYFPAKLEMLQVYENMDVINNTIDEAGGEKFHLDLLDPEDSAYWTSTEIPEDKKAYFIYMPLGNITFSKGSFYESKHVRAMKWFNETE